MRTQLALAWLGLLITVDTSYAYSDPELFAAAALEAGGGGHFYTGSPADGYSCDSCHVGGKPVTVVLSGLPTRYVPGASYEVRVDWTALEHAAASFEITDERGHGAGSVVLPPESERRAAELCEPVADGVLAASLRAVEPERTVVSVPDCGQSSLRVQWTAPTPAVGPVWLSGAVLASNSDQTANGDAATRFSQRIPALGERVADEVLVASCAALPGARHVHGWLGCVLSLGVLVWRRRLWLSAALTWAGCGSAREPDDHVLVRTGAAVERWAVAEVERDASMQDEDAAVEQASGAYLRVTTRPQGGPYAPKNIGAIWVQDEQGRWLRTLELWAAVRIRYLTGYRDANPMRNQVDAITRATSATHGLHALHWDMRDAQGQLVPDGEYSFMIEVTDRSATGERTQIAFEKSAAAQSVTLEDDAFFADVSVQFEP